MKSQEHSKKRNFLNLPKYPGGSDAFREFIKSNLRYPQDALDNKIQGSVVVEYEILDTGEIRNPRVMNGIGYGCDEEAIRLVSMLRYEKVKNRGVRVQVKTRTKINFRLAAVNISYTYTSSGSGNNEQKENQPTTYTYTLFS